MKPATSAVIIIAACVVAIYGVAKADEPKTNRERGMIGLNEAFGQSPKIKLCEVTESGVARLRTCDGEPAPNVMPIKNTAKGRKPIVDAILGELRKPAWLKAHPAQEKKLRSEVDHIVQLTIRGLDQISDMRPVKFR